ncbi:MAG: C39 family peptidase [Roseburia sp.]
MFLEYDDGTCHKAWLIRAGTESQTKIVFRQELSQGHPIICIMGPGDFTTSGHFVVLTGVDSDGKITVNDSNSKKNSNKAWKIDDLMSQIRDLWVYQ